MSDKPDPNQFARLVIYHLAGLRADIAELTSRLAHLQQEVSQVPPDSLQKQWKQDNRDLFERIYIEAIREAHLEETPPSPGIPGASNPPPPSDGDA